MQRFLFAQLFLLTVIFVMLLADVVYQIGEFYWWWDVVEHFFGGTWIGMWSIAMLRYFKIKVVWWHALLAAFLVGIAWEVFEYVVHVGASVWMSYRLDTLKDLCMDTLGGYASYRLRAKIHS